MSDRVEQAEVQAILDAVGGAPGDGAHTDVQPRNFRQPRRLSRERLQYLGQIVNARLQSIGHEVAAVLRQHYKITLASISEVNVLGLLDDYEPPFMVNIFDCKGHVSWVLWDSPAAAAAVETILSGPKPGSDADALDAPDEAETSQAAATEARRLSPSESRVIEGLLAKILVPVADALGLEVVPGSLAQEPEELTTLDDCGPDADARRLMLHFLFDGPGGLSDIRIYLPDVGERDPAPVEGAVGESRTHLPEHLDTVRLDLAAFLGSVDVPLSDLMALEVGDVIPLGVDSGAQVEIHVEDRCCALGTWGRNRGLQAVRVEKLHTHPGEIDEPTDLKS